MRKEATIHCISSIIESAENAGTPTKPDALLWTPVFGTTTAMQILNQGLGISSQQRTIKNNIEHQDNGSDAELRAQLRSVGEASKAG